MIALLFLAVAAFAPPVHDADRQAAQVQIDLRHIGADFPLPITDLRFDKNGTGLYINATFGAGLYAVKYDLTAGSPRETYADNFATSNQLILPMEPPRLLQFNPVNKSAEVLPMDSNGLAMHPVKLQSKEQYGVSMRPQAFDSGRLILSLASNLEVFDMTTGKPLAVSNLDWRPLDSVTVSPLSSRIAVAHISVDFPALPDSHTSIEIRDVRNPSVQVNVNVPESAGTPTMRFSDDGAILWVWTKTSLSAYDASGKPIESTSFDSNVTQVLPLASGNGVVVANVDGNIECLTGEPLNVKWTTSPRPIQAGSIAADPTGRWIAVGYLDGWLEFLDARNGKPLLHTYLFPPPDLTVPALGFVAVDQAGHFDASSGEVKRVAIQREGVTLAAAGIAAYAQPNLAEIALSGMTVAEAGAQGVAPQNASPKVAFLSPADAIATPATEIPVTFECQDVAASIAKVQVRVNGRVAATEERSESHRLATSRSTFAVSLDLGKNVLSVTAVDKFGRESAPAQIAATCAAPDQTNVPLVVTQALPAGGFQAGAFSKDGLRLAALASDRTLRVLDGNSGAVEKILRNAPSQGMIAFSPDGSRVAAFMNGYTVGENLTPEQAATHLTVWDLASSRLLSVSSWFGDPEEHSLGEPIRFSDQRLKDYPELRWFDFAGKPPYDFRNLMNGFELVNSQTGKALSQYKGPEKPLAACPGTGLVFASGPTGCVWWDGRAGRVLRSSTVNPVVAQDLSVRGKSLLFRDYTRAFKWDLDAGTVNVLRHANGDDDPFRPYAIFAFLSASPDGKMFCTGGDGSLDVCSSDGSVVKDLPFTGDPAAACFSPDDKQLAVIEMAGFGKDQSGAGDSVALIDVSSGSQRKVPHGPGRPLAAGILPDNATVAMVNAVQSPTNTLEGWGTPGDPLSLGTRDFETASITTADAATGKTSTHSLPPGRLSVCGIDANQGWCFAGYATGAATLWDIAKSASIAQLSPEGSPAMSYAVSPDGKTLGVGYGDGLAKTFDIPSGQMRGLLWGHYDSVVSVDWLDGDRVVTASRDSTVRIWDKAGKPRFTLLTSREGRGLMLNAAGMYLCDKQALRMVAFNLKGKTYAYDQFDAQLNQPDVVLGELGLTSPATLKMLGDARKERQAKLGGEGSDVALNTRTILQLTFSPADGHVGSAQISASAVAGSKISRIRVTVNGCTIGPVSGQPVATPEASVSQNLAIPLCRGENRLSVTAIDDQGRSSIAASAALLDDSPPGHDLYMVAVGVNHYANSGHDLRFCADDAKAMAEAFSAQSALYSHVHAKVLVDADATKAGIEGLGQFLDQARPQDTVIFFLAGHGMVGSDKLYYYGNEDIDFQNPARAGVSYQKIEDLLASCASRSKLLMMDTCNAGARDEAPPGEGNVEESVLTTQVETPETARSVPVTGGPVGSEPLSFEALRSRFAEFSADSGTIVLAAAGGYQFAYESSGHGAFTRAVLDGLTGGADLGKTGEITVRDLQTYVSNAVLRATGGKQQPVFRREEIEFDPVIAYRPGLLARTSGNGPPLTADVLAGVNPLRIDNLPDAKRVSIGGKTEVRQMPVNRILGNALLDSESLKTLWSNPVADPLSAQQFTRDGSRFLDWVRPQLFSSTADYELKLLCLSTPDGAVRWTASFPGHGPQVFSGNVSISTDGRKAVVSLSTDGGELAMVDMQTGQILWRKPLQTYGQCLNKDGSIIAAFVRGQTFKLVLLNGSNASLRKEISSDVLNDYSLAMSDDGNLVAVGCHDRSLRLYDTRAPGKLIELGGSRAIPEELEFLPNNRLWVSDASGETVWDLKSVAAQGK